ncbi:MAG: fused response regulator/phosphatase [Spongiibacteraceae bacterium]
MDTDHARPDTGHPRLKVLVVDDNELQREVLCEQLRLLGHQVCVGENGEQAIWATLEENPDVILMDMMMPVLDGIEATKAIRMLPDALWTPIIMLSAFADEHEFINALKNGCDDYLVKPIKLSVLEAKIYALQRIAAMHREIESSRRELQYFYTQADEELNLARHIMARLVQRKEGDGERSNINTQSWSQPASSVSGDIILSGNASKNMQYTMLADATGHGLAAAITLIPIVNVFYAMTAKGFGVAAIVEEMNRLVRTYCPVERFVALTLVGINLHESTIEVWNGGIPPLLLLDADGREVRQFKSRYLPLGILGPENFKSEPEFFHYDDPLQLVAFSDGLLEAGDQEYFGMERIRSALGTVPPAQRLASVQRALHDFLGDTRNHDDVSLALIDCPLPSTVVESSEPAIKDIDRNVARAAGNDWSLQTTLSAQQLKTIDFVPMVINWAQAMGLARDRASIFFLVVTELYINALEHGLLELSSSIKLEENGFERFMEMRQQRLQALTEGQIHISIFSRRSDDGAVLSVQLRDSGKGFVDSTDSDSNLVNNKTPSGRGIALVKKFCRTLEYRGCGNEVYAELLC